MRTKEGNRILAVLREHVGAELAISAPDICRELGWRLSRERTVRQIIADESALWPDALVCSTPGTGFYLAADYDEVVRRDHLLADLAEQAVAKRDGFRQQANLAGFRLPVINHEEVAAHV